MSVWIFLWLLVSAALIYFSAWTSLIVLKQKRNWADFAQRHKLRFQAETLLNPPKMGGLYKGYEISLFPSEHTTSDSRGIRKLTAIEVMLKSAMPCEGAIGSGGMVQLIQDLDFTEEIRPQEKWWNPSHIIKTSHSGKMEAYLTPERLKILMALSKIKNIWMIFIFRGPSTILRIDTPDGLETIPKLEKILKAMLETAQALELAEGEYSRLNLIKKKAGAASAKLKAPEPEGPPSLQLEDE